MKYLIIIGNEFPLLCEDKIIYFDTEEETKGIVEYYCTYIVDNRDNISIKPIDVSEINDDKFINYKDVTIM